MHIPDGFLDGRTALAAGAMAAAGLGVALRQVRRTLPPRRVPLIGLAAAFVFAAQLLNFPVGGGTSGHLLGATLATVLLGPGAAIVAMSAVLILQCLMFADGGLTALGANVFNIAVVAPVVGSAVYRAVRLLAPAGLRGRLLGAAFGAWVSTVTAAIACAGELAASGTVPWRAAFPAMAGVHMVIGLGEAAITALVLAAVAGARPELLEDAAPEPAVARYGVFATYGVVVALGLAVFVAPVASGFPDGLEKVAEALGFAARARETPAPMPGYAVPFLGTGVSGTMLAGVVGTVVAFGTAWLLARGLTPTRRPRRQDDLPGGPDAPLAA